MESRAYEYLIFVMTQGSKLNRPAGSYEDKSFEFFVFLKVLNMLRINVYSLFWFYALASVDISNISAQAVSSSSGKQKSSSPRTILK